MNHLPGGISQFIEYPPFWYNKRLTGAKMNYHMAQRPQLFSLAELLIRIGAALASGVFFFGISILGVLIVYSIAHAREIYPGVSVGGIDLSGLKLAEATRYLSEQLAFTQQGKVVFQDGGKIWIASPGDLGLYLDPENSARSAYQYGRQGFPPGRWLAQFGAWYRGKDLAPIVVFDQRLAYNFLDALAAEINRPTVEASLSVKGTEVEALPGQVGRNLDIPATMTALEGQLRNMTDGLVPLVIEETPPSILDASQQAEIARKIISAPLTLTIPEAKEGDPGPWTFDRETLAGMLKIQRVENQQGGQFQVGLDVDKIGDFLTDLAPKADRKPANARFIFNDETHQLEVIQPALIGRTLNVKESLQEINQKLAQGEHNVALKIAFNQPQIGDDATGEQLGIKELVSAETSYFYGSSAERIHNIQTAAARFHGVLVPPGATFSMGEVLGDVSLDNGYAEALIIFGNRTIKGVGGGVCQVSTTLFRTAFFGGFPIVERHPHAYRVTYYELTRAGGVDTSLAGLDATVFVPVVDFKFSNDTPHWLLMETYVNAAARTLTWKFYSTTDRRTVEWETTGLQNIEEPDEPTFQENPELAEGEIEQVDWEVEGADITVERTIYRDGQVYLQDQFFTHYIPWRAVYEYGPGTNPKKLQKLLGDEPPLP